MVLWDPEQNEPVSLLCFLTELTSDKFCLCRGGHYLNFDLAFPSQAIPSNFFPSDAAEYGASRPLFQLSNAEKDGNS
jgi:hypothetical protein